jgi:hypothetical protein
MVKYNYNEILNRTDLIEIINNNTTFAGIMRDVGLPVVGKLGSIFKKKLLNAGFDLSHLTGVPKVKYNKKSLEEHLCKGSTTKSSKLKLILFKHGLKINKCECCGIETWNNLPIVMQLHHIDGDPTNNTIENLQILCPNCHSQTDTYCKSTHTNSTIKKVYTCPICGEEMKCKTSKHCKRCNAILNRKIEWPQADILKNYIDAGNSITHISKLYNVSRPTVKKWLQRYNIVTK